MDCHRSCDFLLSDEGKEAITQLHIDGIVSYVRAYEYNQRDLNARPTVWRGAFRAGSPI